VPSNSALLWYSSTHVSGSSRTAAALCRRWAQELPLLARTVGHTLPSDHCTQKTRRGGFSELAVLSYGEEGGRFLLLCG
jgi:hypothetical protein